MSQVRIKFKGISIGKYNYQFNLNDYFFTKFEESEIKKADIIADIEMIVSKDLLTFNFNIKGIVGVQCDRCLEYFNKDISHEATLYVEFGSNNSDISDADNKIVLSHSENEIVLEKHLYDYIHLSLPYQRVHPDKDNGENGCNNEIIVNSEEKKETDPRWDKLKELYN